MFTKTYYYLVRLQYLGYRFHGWQKQPNLKTVQYMVDRTLKYVLEGRSFKTLTSGRTDAKVSALGAAFELFLKDHPIEDFEEFLDIFNENLPQDLRALSIEEVDHDFNVIQHVREKEYLYLFAHGKKLYPFCSPIMATVLSPLNIEIMKQGARLFEGTHNFRSYCFRSTENGNYVKTIESCELMENEMFTANFFPENSYLLRVKGHGFGRNQIRLMMGALIELGMGKRTLDQIRESLAEDYPYNMQYMAPASGLILNRIEFFDKP